LTRKQAEGLEKELKSQGNFKVLIAMRYWHPTTEEAIDQMGRLNLKRVVLLPLYPQFSTATTESSFKEFERVRKEKGGENWEVLKIPHWYDHPLVIDSLVLQIKNALQNIPVLENQPLHIVFSAHGVPLRLIQKGDPYQNQIEENVRLIGQSLGGSYPIHLCYQSRVGPLRWTGPSTDEMLKDLAAHGVKNLLMIPISFVSDHSETLYEMDILYRDLAHQLGIHGFHRMPSLNDSPAFIKALSGIVVDSCHSNRWL
jgi:ferrochelatase